MYPAKLLLAFSAAVGLLTGSLRAVPSFTYSGSASTAPNGRIVSGQSYSVGVVLQPCDANIQYNITMTKDGSTFHTSGGFSQTFGNYGYQLGPYTVTDTGNKSVTFYSTASVNTGTTPAGKVLTVRIYIPDTTAIPAPTAFSASGIQSTQFGLSWQWAPGTNLDGSLQALDHYEVEVNNVVQWTGTATNCTVTGLTPSTTYNVKVRTYSWGGNYSAYSSTIPVTTAAPPDTTAPTQPGALSFSNVGASGFTANWGASTDNVGVQGYSISLSTNGTVIQTPPDTTSTTCTFSNLSPTTSYTVSVTAYDGNGNRSTARTGSQTTTSLPVTIDPGKPSGLSASNVTTTGMTISWSPATDGHAVSFYTIRCNGTSVNLGQDASGKPVTTRDYTGLIASTLYTFDVMATDPSGHVSPWSDPLVMTTAPTLVVLPATVTRPTVGSVSLVATPAPEVTVDNHGAANVTIPLQIGVGRSGMAPNLSLQYSSSAGNGALGVGFSLSTGFPQSVVRGRSILARDGMVRGVTFTQADKFYLDGKRLICTSGTYGQSGSTYHTEVDSFSEISATNLGGTVGGTIDTFTVLDKSGRKYVFGKFNATADGFQKGGGETGDIAFSYALKRVEDSLGNYIDITYSDLGNGEYVLGQIDYTGIETTAGSQRIVFAYEGGRTDQPVTYLGNRAFAHRARLALITAKSNVGGSWYDVSKYSLNYDYASDSNRSRLRSVDSFLADPQSPTLALTVCKTLTVGWQKYEEKLVNVPNAVTNMDVEWADTNGDGSDEPIQTTDTYTWWIKLADVDGDGLRSSALAGITVSDAQNAAIARYLSDPPTNGTTGGTMLRTAEGMGISSRYTYADFNGDGRDDLLIHGFDGKIHVFLSQGTSFSDALEDSAHAPYVGGEGNITWESGWMGQGVFNVWINNHYYVKPMPCDLNGDGRMDYVCFVTQRFTKGYSTPTGYTIIRKLVGVLSKSDGTFSSPFPIGGAAMMVPVETGDDGQVIGSIKINDLIAGAQPGDFNGDGLTDFLVLVPEFAKQSPDLFNVVYGGKRWCLYINQGEDSSGTPRFTQYNGPIPNQVTIGGVSVNTWFSPIWSSTGFLNNPIGLYNGTDPIGRQFMAGLEGAAGSINNLVMDINHDGLADLVWYAANNPDGSPVSSPGWYAMLSSGNFANGSGFTGPVKVDRFNSLPGGVITNAVNGAQPFSGTMISHSLDANGDGQPDYVAQAAPYNRPNGVGTLYAAAPLDATSAAPFSDLVTSFTDGLGRVTTLAYKAAKDSAVYTPGVAVTYPIREVRASNPVVSDVYKDSGGSTAARFSYQYSGNRTDMSGRGSLGFHSFITLDQQTGLFKYQFLAQSFPMTGLSQREQTYRYWANGANARVRLINSHDNSVVFDEVVSTGGTVYGTLYPFISEATEYRWEDSGANTDANAHFTTTNPETLFSSTRPANPYITIKAQSWFDNQALASAPQTTLPASLVTAGFNPGDVNPTTGLSVAVAASAFTLFDSLPRKITYGNLRQLKTDYGDGFTENVVTTYLAPPSGSNLTGLVDQVTTTVTSTNYGTQTAPVKTYTYFTTSTGKPTPLVRTDATAGGGNLDFTITHSRDDRGRIKLSEVTGAALLVKGASSATYTTYQATGFDDTIDLPTIEKNGLGHTTTTSYYTPLAKPVSISGPNGETTTTNYDPLGRVIYTKDRYNQETWTTYSFDTSQTVNAPAGSGGLNLSSAYLSSITATAKPYLNTYYDRLGRPIRTVKEGYGSQTATSDTVYNLLGQTVAVSNPYAASAAYWTTSVYDALGRIKTVTAPNGTVTSTTYQGRATIVNVDAANLGGADPAAQVNSTVVDAKGRTVKVWNADNVPTFSDDLGTTGTAPSLSFDLDGFGRMRTTSLKGQTATITATYDSLGRQTALNDPDKGNWSYLNSALGYVLEQTDARNTVTGTKYDILGRPILRTATESGAGAPVETANWYYYDSVADDLGHRVTYSTKGWIGALQSDTVSTVNGPGFAASNSAVSNVHYYDTYGRPSIDLTTIDSKWFYTYTDYDSNSRVKNVRHYWRPANQESPSTASYMWQDFGYSYTYDSKSYLTSLSDSLNRTWWMANPSDGYDFMDRPVKIQKGSGLWTRRTYRPEDGVLTGIATGPAAGDTSVQNLTFNYDGLGNLRYRSGSGGNETLDYDSLNRLTSTKQGPISYFDNGNIQKKPDVAGNLPGTDFAYGSSHPHAVTSAFGFTMDYDANGNLNSRGGSGETWRFRYAGFDKPRWMTRTTGSGTFGSEFLYNANRSRTIQLEYNSVDGTGVPSHYVRKRVYGLGATLEANYDNVAPTDTNTPNWKLKKVRIYVPGPEGVIGAREFDPTAQFDRAETALVYHYDHLGSIESITPFGSTGTSLANDGSGKVGRFSEDAWGARRNPTTWSGPPLASDDGGPDSLTPRGFTGHEMLDDLGLIHMNGRIYDPLLGRMLSADLMVQNPGNLQDYNRYSYVKNNPLSLTDPSGFMYDSMPGDSKYFGREGAAIGENLTESYQAGKAHMEAAATEWDAASSSITPGLDRTIAVLHGAAAVKSATETVMNFMPAGKGEKAVVGVVERAATKAEVAAVKVESAVAKVEGKAATLEKRVEGVVAGDGAKVSEKAATVEAKTAETASTGGKKMGGESAAAADGRRAHENYGTALGSGYDTKVILPSGKKPDAVNFAKKEVRELKPDSARAIKRGERQVEPYRKELEEVTGQDGWTSAVDTYQRKKRN